MIGYIDTANEASLGCTRHGLSPSGPLPSVAYKFGQWADMVMVQRSLGTGGTTTPDVWQAVAPDDGGA